MLATLWPVSDRESAAFAADLYRALSSGVTVSEAVRGAQLSARRAGKPARVWGGFVVTGDGRARFGRVSAR